MEAGGAATEEGAEEGLEVRCGDCGATLRLAAHRFATVCPYCASPAVVERPAEEEGARRERPRFAVGFQIDRAEAERRVKRWLGRSRLFAPSELRDAKLRSVEGIYLPAWLYGATARSRYFARIGENYTETETYTTTDSKGNVVMRTRVVTKTEWRDLHGTHADYVVDVIVTASKGLGNTELEAIEPYDLRSLRRYDPALVAGWIAEEATLTRETGGGYGRIEAQRLLASRLGGFLPGDSHRLESFDTEFDNEGVDLVLLPVWVLAARWGPDKKTLRILINGQTGEVHGKVPKSPARIALFTLAFLVVLAGFSLLTFWLAGGLG